MAAKAKPIPDGYHTITPHLVIRGAAKAIEFYKNAFGAEELSRAEMEDGMLMHAEIKIGNSVLMLVDEMPMMERWVSPPALKGTTVGLAIYTEDSDALFQRALDAGATVSLPLMDAFWGDRYGKLTDPFGHEWEICTRLEDLTPAEVAQRAQAFFASFGGCEPE